MTNHNFGLNIIDLCKSIFVLSVLVLATTPTLCIEKENSASKAGKTSLSKSSWRRCPNKCLKLSTKGWKNRSVPGKPNYLVWMDYPHPNGAIEYWSIDHLGEFIKYSGGLPRNYGLCQTCGGKLFVGNPVKYLKSKKAIPRHPKTTKVQSQRVIGRPWVKILINDRYGEVNHWYNQLLPRYGWAIVDKGTVPGAYLFVITNGIKSKWVKISSSNRGQTELIMMDRRTR